MSFNWSKQESGRSHLKAINHEEYNVTTGCQYLAVTEEFGQATHKISLGPIYSPDNFILYIQYQKKRLQQIC